MITQDMEPSHTTVSHRSDWQMAVVSDRPRPVARSGSLRLLSSLKRRSKSRPISALTSPMATEPAPASIATNLPTEVLVEIFRCIERVKLDPTVIRPIVTDGIYTMALICKSWYGPFTKVAYETIEFPRVACVFRFLETLQTSPHLRPLVKSLLLPGRVGVSCPELLVKAFVKIIHLVESLEHLYTTCPFLMDPRFAGEGAYTGNHHLVPITHGRHSRLKYLLLYSETTKASVFPSAIVHNFSQLTFLSLNGFFLRDDVDPDKVPVLEKLYNFHAVGGNVMTRMDKWIRACPVLGELYLCYTEIPNSTTETPPISILETNKIFWLSLTHMFPHATRPYSGSWLARCSSVRALRTTWDLFSSGKEFYPSYLESLTLEVGPKDGLTMDPFKTYLSARPYVGKFDLVRCKHENWTRKHSETLERSFKEASIPFQIQEVACKCAQSTSEWKERRMLLPSLSMAHSRQDIVKVVKWEWSRF